MPTILEQAQHYYDLGLAVIPTKGKIPITKNWQEQATGKRIEPGSNFASATGVGIVCGTKIVRDSKDYWLAAIDIDCLDITISRDLVEQIRMDFGDHIGYRFGKKPKVLVPVLVTSPITKMQSQRHMHNDEPAQLEILASGQQFIAEGIHPDTGRPYTWAEPLDINTMPIYTPAELHERIEQFEAHFPETQTSNILPFNQSNDPDDDDDFMRGTRLADWYPVDSQHLLERFTNTNDITYDAWISVGMALHHQHHGSQDAFRLFKDWSATNHDKYDPLRMRTKWESFSDAGSPVTMRTVMLMEKAARSTIEVFKGNEDIKVKGLTWSTALGEGKLEVNWQIEHIFEQQRLVMLYGPAGAGKSFIALDMAQALAAGREWHGLRTIKTNVVYVPGEGHDGLTRRLKAWKEVNEYIPKEDEGFHITDGGVNLNDKASCQWLREQLDGLDEPPGLIVFDTLARSAIGMDENSSQDMGQIIETLTDLKARYGATILMIHHTGKSSTDEARGSSALKAGVDNEIRVTSSQGQILFEGGKNKEAKRTEGMYFRLQDVNFAEQDNFGNPITSAAIIPVDPSEAQATSKPLSSNQQFALDAIASVFETHPLPGQYDGLELTDEEVFKLSADHVDYESVYERFKSILPGGESKKNIRSAFNKAVEGLISKDEIVHLDGQIWGKTK